MASSSLSDIVSRATFGYIRVDCLAAFLRLLDPSNHAPIVFSTVAAEWKKFTRMPFAAFFCGLRPAEVAELPHTGQFIEFSRDSRVPPLLYARRCEPCPHTPIETMPSEWRAWASKAAALEPERVDFAAAEKESGLSRDCLLAGYLQEYGRQHAPGGKVAPTWNPIAGKYAIGTVHRGRIVRETVSGKGFVVAFPDGATGFLPMVAFGAASEYTVSLLVDRLSVDGGTFRVVGVRPDQGKMLLNFVTPAHPAPAAPCASGVDSAVIAFEAMASVRANLKAAAAALERAEAVLLKCETAGDCRTVAQKALRAGLVQACALMGKAWHGRTATVAASDGGSEWTLPASIAGEAASGPDAAATLLDSAERHAAELLG